ncbi:MAG: ImmA/IrrE family metallo-endopeptidase [Enterococcus italicus]|uniref:ImmA/IrrE family metallo-endopeptidase n=1 Tax=Enterococcus italicus TaxID=246144 RepID=UPI0039963F94
MDRPEKLMAAFPHLEYKFEPLMPAKLKGLYQDEVIYLNPVQTPEELVGTIGEEIGHYLTTVGNIIEQDTNLKRKQERQARDIGAILAVSPVDIVDCFNDGCKTILECAAYLGVTKEVFEDAISYYATKFDKITVKDKYTIHFYENGSVGVLKIF